MKFPLVSFHWVKLMYVFIGLLLHVSSLSDHTFIYQVFTPAPHQLFPYHWSWSVIHVPSANGHLECLNVRQWKSLILINDRRQVITGNNCSMIQSRTKDKAKWKVAWFFSLPLLFAFFFSNKWVTWLILWETSHTIQIWSVNYKNPDVVSDECL